MLFTLPDVCSLQGGKRVRREDSAGDGGDGDQDHDVRPQGPREPRNLVTMVPIFLASNCISIHDLLEDIVQARCYSIVTGLRCESASFPRDSCSWLEKD